MQNVADTEVTVGLNYFYRVLISPTPPPLKLTASLPF